MIKFTFIAVKSAATTAVTTSDAAVTASATVATVAMICAVALTAIVLNRRMRGKAGSVEITVDESKHGRD